MQVFLDAELLAEVDRACSDRVVGRKLLLPHLIRTGLDALPPLPGARAMAVTPPYAPVVDEDGKWLCWETCLVGGGPGAYEACGWPRQCWPARQCLADGVYPLPEPGPAPAANYLDPGSGRTVVVAVDTPTERRMLGYAECPYVEDRTGCPNWAACELQHQCIARADMVVDDRP